MKHTIRLLTLAALLVALAPAQAPAQGASFETLRGGVKARTLVEGDGAVARPGQLATVHIIGWLDENGARGKELYNSYREGRPVTFLVGTDKVMPAWNAAVEGARVGTRRMLLIPPAMGYGARGVDELVPPNAPLMFQLELIAVKDSD